MLGLSAETSRLILLIAILNFKCFVLMNKVIMNLSIFRSSQLYITSIFLDLILFIFFLNLQKDTNSQFLNLHKTLLNN